MESDLDMTSAEGNRQWALKLAYQGKIEMAAEAMRTAAALDPLNADRRFDYAKLLVRLAETQSPYFRDQTWAAARRAAEHGQRLHPESEVGPAIYETILRAELADAEVTKDQTPMRHLPRSVKGRRRSEPGPIGKWLAERKSTIEF